MSDRIRIEGVWKDYPRWGGERRTLRGALERRLPGRQVPRERRWALQDVSCAFGAGEATGVIGANGAGKSTLLRLASGLGAPTRGRILLPESTASVLSLGYTFDLALTGRENALTAALLGGLRAAQARAAVPRALAWAELEEFAEAPLRTYSDGMRLRLAFGVIAQLRPAALLLDEVMAVGDLRFQEKCLAHIAQLREDGTAVLFASHGLGQVVEQCDRAIWLQDGRVRVHADVEEVVERYQAAMHDDTLALTPPPSPADGGTGDGALRLGTTRLGSQELTIDRVRIGPPPGTGDELRAGAPLEVRLDVRAQRPVEDPQVVVTIRRPSDELIVADLNTEAAGARTGVLADAAAVVLRIDRLELAPGSYTADVGVFERAWAHAYDVHLAAYSFEVRGNGVHNGVLVPAHTWTVLPP